MSTRKMARQPAKRAAARKADGARQGYPRTMVPPQLDPLPAVQA